MRPSTLTSTVSWYGTCSTTLAVTCCSTARYSSTTRISSTVPPFSATALGVGAPLRGSLSRMRRAAAMPPAAGAFSFGSPAGAGTTQPARGSPATAMPNVRHVVCVFMSVSFAKGSLVTDLPRRVLLQAVVRRADRRRVVVVGSAVVAPGGGAGVRRGPQVRRRHEDDGALLVELQVEGVDPLA